METILTFDISEYQVLDTIEFEEEVSRPQELRFFTLDEQLRDFFEKSLPSGKPTKYQLKQLAYDRERIRTMYERSIIFGGREYEVQTHRNSLHLSWVHPVYTELKYEAYSFEKEYDPLFSKTGLSQPNYYTRLLKALPTPFHESKPSIDYPTEVLDNEGKNPVKVLMNYERTKRIIRDDGTMDIVSTPIENTGDQIGLKGYYLSEREKIPNPLNDHPFLKSAKASFYETDLPLMDVFPSTQAILEHGIPITKDPYNEGLKYLKLYDLSLSSIPWTLWKQRFPPVELKQSPKNVIQIEIPKHESYKPSEILTKTYDFKWESGYHHRYWLAKQADGGRFVSQLLLSKSSAHGLIAIGTPEGPSIQHPTSSIDMCQSLTSDFDTFLHAGLYRYGKLKDGFEISDGTCIPVGSIQQEKSSINKNKIGWKETTENDILTTHLKLYKSFLVNEKEDFVTYTKVDHLQESELRKSILVILEDDLRSPEDKYNSILLLLKETEYKNKQYFQNDIFVICQHTLSILNGNLEENPQNFYNEWTSISNGKRVCNYCGEQVSNEVVIAVEEYDDSGHLVMTYESLENRGITETTIDSFTNSLLELKLIFDLKHAGESALFILLAFLQIIPQEIQLLPVLGLMRDLTKALKSKSKISKEAQDRIEGLLCIPAIITILQTHQPFLIPKRSLGRMPIQLSGYPRDSTDPNNSPILDSIIKTLKKTMEEIGSTKGPINELAKYIISKPQKVHDESLPFIKVFATKFNSLFEAAKDRYIFPDEEISFNSITFPEMKIDKPIFKTGDTIEDEKHLECQGKTIINWNTKKLPYGLQIPLKLDSKISPSPDMVLLQSYEIPAPSKSLTQEEINKGLNLSIPSSFKILEQFMKGFDSSTFIKLSERILDYVSTTKFDKQKQIDIREKLQIPYKSQSEMRDTAKSLFLILLNQIKDTPNIVRILGDAFKSDLVFRMIFVSKEKAESEEFELRTKETSLLKARYRGMTDTRRQLVKSLVDIGIADFIVTNEDRELFSKEFERNVEKEYEDLEKAEDLNRPEEGYNVERDYVDNGDVPQDFMGNEMDIDFGEYGDRAVRDYNDYTGEAPFDEE